MCMFVFSTLLSALMLRMPTCFWIASPSHRDVATGLPGWVGERRVDGRYYAPRNVNNTIITRFGAYLVLGSYFGKVIRD